MKHFLLITAYFIFQTSTALQASSAEFPPEGPRPGQCKSYMPSRAEYLASGAPMQVQAWHYAWSTHPNTTKTDHFLQRPVLDHFVDVDEKNALECNVLQQCTVSAPIRASFVAGLKDRC